jgi:CheY-like chemotaxis protein
LPIKFEPSGKLPQFLKGDVGRLRQVLLNLISNALKFTEKGQITVKAEQIAYDGGKALLRFGVVDTGIGIDPAVKDQLFQSFVQADSSISRRFGGTGLGLSICKKIVELQGGSIGVDSTPGVGSHFWFQLAFAAGAPGDVPTVVPPVAVSSAAGMRILLAEDNVVNQKVASSLLKKAGHSVEIAGNGREALDLISAGEFDVVLMDMHMPEMDGLEATKAIRAMPAPVSQIPIVALTAAGAESDVQTCMDAGMNYFLVKPFRMERLDIIFKELSERRTG